MQNAVQYFLDRRDKLPPNIRRALHSAAGHQLDQRSGLYLPGKKRIIEHNRFFLLSLGTALGDGPALTASTTPTSLLPAAVAKNVLSGQTYLPGQQWLAIGAGRISNIVTTPGTLTLDIRFGSVIVANGGAMSLNVVAKSNVPWYLCWLLTCRAVGNGTAANVMHQGTWTSESVIGSGVPTAGGAGTHMLPNAAPAVGTGFDSTANQTVDFFGTWSLNNANSIQVHQWGFIEVNG